MGDNTPEHYRMEGFDSIEFVDEVLGDMEAMLGHLQPRDAYCIKDALKYAMRAGKKGDWRDDAYKCADYLVRFRIGMFGNQIDEHRKAADIVEKDFETSYKERFGESVSDTAQKIRRFCSLPSNQEFSKQIGR